MQPATGLGVVLENLQAKVATSLTDKTVTDHTYSTPVMINCCSRKYLFLFLRHGRNSYVGYLLDTFVL